MSVNQWTVTGRVGDFDTPLEDLFRTYLYNQWEITAPPRSSTLAGVMADKADNVMFGDWEYDRSSTYYVRVKEGETRINFNTPRANLHQFETPIYVDIFVRRHTKGEAFPQINSMVNEIIRIVGQWQAGDISGVEAVRFEGYGPMTEFAMKQEDIQLAFESQQWHKRITVTLIYWKMNTAFGI